MDYSRGPFFTGRSPKKLDANSMEWEEISQNNNVQLSTLNGFKDHSRSSPNNQSKNFFTGRNTQKTVSSPLSLLSSLKISEQSRPNKLGLFDDFYANCGEESQTNYDSKTPQGPLIQHKTGWLSNGRDTCFYFQTTGVAYKRNYKPPSTHCNNQPISPMEIDSFNSFDNKDLSQCDQMDSCMEVSRASTPSKSFGCDVSKPLAESSPIKNGTSLHKDCDTKALSSKRRWCSFKIILLFIVLCPYLLLQLYKHQYIFHDRNEDGVCFDLNLLKDNLKSNMFGQHIALDAVCLGLKGFLDSDDQRKVLTLSMHGSSGTGKSFLAQHIKSLLPDDRTLYFPVAKTFKSDSVEPNVEHFQEEIGHLIDHPFWSLLNRKSSDCPFLVIMDNMEFASKGLMNELVETIDLIKGGKYVGSKVIFLLVSSTGSEVINEIFFHSTMHASREDIGSNLFLKNQTFVERLESSWFGKMLKMKVVDGIVPFLPLEKQHVEMCARRHVREKNAEMSENVIRRIVDDVEQYNRRSGEFSGALGCKKVSLKVDEVIYSNICKTNSGVSLLDNKMQREICENK